MKRNRTVFTSESFHRILAGSAAAVALLCQTVLGQTIPNPSFETDTFTVSPGYISGNTTITGWTGTPADRVGLNPSGGTPFANNGAIPAGNNVAFIQANATDPGTPSTLSTTISGLTVGTTYKVTFRANATSTNVPNVKVYINGVAVLLPGGPDGFSTAAVGGSSPYWYVAFEFTAAAASQTLSIVNDASSGTGDHTVLVDDFKIAPTSGRWSVAAWTGDGDSGVDASFFYTHAYNFGSAANVTINNINFTGIGGGAPAVAEKFSTTFFAAGPVGDTFTLVGDNSATMAAAFVYGGNVPAGSFQSITVTNLTPGTEYVMTIYSVAWEDPRLDARWLTVSVADDYLTLNQDKFMSDGGIRISYRYIADSSGAMTLKVSPLIQGTTFHAYGFANREAVSRFVAPVISAHPQSAIVSPDVPVTFSVTASGVPLPTYQWRFNGNAVTGEVNPTYALPSVTSANAGLYDVIVSNTAGSVTSQVARLTVGIIPIPNPSFEVDAFLGWPGYVSGNSPITGWNALGGHGINSVQGNPANGPNPFADNGTKPHGDQVAFMQADGALSQPLSGFTVGAQYYVHYYENAREGNTPALELQVGGNAVVATHIVTSVGGSNPYREVSSQMFTASAASLDLAFIKSNPLGGDNTVLVDNVAIIQVLPGTPPTISQQPQSTTVYLGQVASFGAVVQGSLPLAYQWRRNGQPVDGATGATFTIPAVGLADEGGYTVVVTNSSGSVTSVVAQLSLLESIPSLRNTGIDGGGVAQPGGAVSPFWTLPINADGASTDAIVGINGFPVDGPWVANNATSKWLGPRATLGDATIPVGDYHYRTTFDLSNRDTNTVLIAGRWAADNYGLSVSVNGQPVSVPLSTGFGSWTAFTITSSTATFLPGINTMVFVVHNADAPGPSGLRVEFTQTSARTLPGVPAAIAIHPQGGKVVEGDTVVLNVSPTGTLPITYQWKKDAVNLPGKTNNSLTLTGVTTNDSGNYTVAVSNLWGGAISSNATVTIAYRPIAGIYGTGLDANGALLAAGATDPHFILAVSADPGYPGPNAIVVNEAWPIAPAGPWLANGPNSKWIGPRAEQDTITDPAVGNAEGDYTYQTTFNLTGYDVSKVSVVGSWATDNTGVDVMVNGVSTGITSPGFGSYVTFTINSRLVAGNNTLDFKMNNAPATPNPTALRVNLRGLLDIQPSAPSVRLQIGLSGNTISISWSPTATGWVLQWAPEATGPWTDIVGAPNPYTTTTGEAKRFYRVKQ